MVNDINPDNISSSIDNDDNRTETVPPGPTRGIGQLIPRISLQVIVLNARAQLFDVFSTCGGTIQRSHCSPGDPHTPREPWPQYGVLRAEVVRDSNPKHSLADFYAKQFYGSNLDNTDELDDPLTELYSEAVEDAGESSSRQAHRTVGAQTTQSTDIAGNIQFTTIWSLNYIKHNVIFAELTHMASLVKSVCFRDAVLPRVSSLATESGPVHMEENYMVYYALDYGFLRLSPVMRRRLNITVKLVVLHSEKDACFGEFVSRF
ncbi:hypothetical protein FGIG_02537 [Fasciola gigantica]|uniref:Uncharacterized protein n=1 Tax=Fasciola gigantica TaxID=46835 RepID=A0A504YIA8_FASGI|nr:hypothetical protein FGIG_02537 [Fasciola gigantica]